jgi:predicted phage terminase large subunit-like protein
MRERERRDRIIEDRETLPGSLRNFIENAWHILEPATPFSDNWHVGAICEHLEAVTERQIRNLLITVPPRCMKSLQVSVLWQPWVWASKPWERWLNASYGQILSTRDSVKARRLIDSPWYQARWGERFSLTTDQNTKTRFENDRSGYRIATSVDGMATGEGGDVIVVDDPHNVKEALSEVQRDAVIDWWDQTMSTRFNDPETGCRVMVMQRIHERDLAGHVLEQGDWEHLMLPMEFEPERAKATSIGFMDPRKTAGELLWPGRFSAAAVTDLKTRLGSYGTAGQLQQRPAPREGGFFSRGWFEIVREAPADAKRVRYWDLAATKETAKTDPDWTVGAKLAAKDGQFWIEDIRRKRGSPKEIEDLVRVTAALDGAKLPIWMEQEPGSSGKNTIDHYARHILVGFPFRGDPKTGSKESLADPVSAAAEAGNVKLISGPWNATLLDEFEAFPNGAHDDQVDGVSGAFAKLAKPVYSGPGVW